ncbi:MAG: ATP-dependent Clp protease ATP-binding subunit [Prevotella sp.]|nr:ATP-dependent Clp protease ATP-binding subunit [Prevotella sp.]
MANQFSPKISEVLAFSREEALRLASPEVAPEHLLLGILRDKTNAVKDMLDRHAINIHSMKVELENRLRSSMLSMPVSTAEPTLSEKADNILKLAVLEARLQRVQTVEIQHLFLAILHDKVNNGAKEVLETNNMNYEDALLDLHPNSIVPRNGLGLSDEDDFGPEEGLGRSANTEKEPEKVGKDDKKSKTPVLDNFSTDLTKAAAEEKLDPVVGRVNEMQRVMEILCRRKKNNPILIGEPGVGKSAIVEGLAQLVNKHQTSPILYNKRVVSLDMTSIVAGTKYRGQFEERIKALIKELEQNPDIIVFVDEIHTLVGAGSTPGSMDAANILKPALARGTIQCIGATTLDEYRNSIEKDGALERRFQKVLVEPTDKAETLRILENIRGHYEAHHHVRYSDEALRACVNLTERYITDRSFPDKAIDALDEVGARLHLKNANVPPEILEKEKEIEAAIAKKQEAVKNQSYELAASWRDRQVKLNRELEELKQKWSSGDSHELVEVCDADVADVISSMTGVPVQRMAENENIRLKGMDVELKKSVVAQDKAIEKMVKAIQRNRVGLRDPNHPIGAFMFLGPTGVGKTYLAKKLAEQMFGSADALIRIDMSEYTESFNVSRLIGAPPGYVGYEEGGQLTERVRRHPYSIVLLDEIEKAHGNIFNLLLQVLDEGRLTDGNGRFIDFRNTVIIMTSNAGTRQLKEFGRGVGFEVSALSDMDERGKEYARKVVEKELKKLFSPEFLNRLDEIITFDQLDQQAILNIVDIELSSLFKRVKGMGYELQITDKAKEFVASKGYDIQFGARPLKRAIQQYVEDGLCELLLDNSVKAGALVSIGKHPSKEELTFKVL